MLKILFTELSYPGNIYDWQDEFEYIIQELDRRKSNKEEYKTSRILKDIFWCLEIISELDPNCDKGPKFTGGRICNETGEEIKGKHFSIGKKRYSLKAKRCWLSNEPLVKKHYHVYCFTRKYDGVHIYRTMNPDSRDKWT